VDKRDCGQMTKSKASSDTGPRGTSSPWADTRWWWAGISRSTWRIYTQLAAGLADRIARLSETERAQAREALPGASQAFMEGGRLRLAATALCALGREP
jgi:hypothetical protein